MKTQSGCGPGVARTRCLSLLVLACAASSPAALAQSALGSRIHPITGKVKRAGTYHLATGTWTRPGQESQAFLNDEIIVYANTCTSGYYGGQDPGGGEIWTDEGAIPDQNMPKAASQAPGGGNDTEPGCASTYNITGFQVAYCTFQSVFTATINFYDNYEAPGVFCTVPATPTASFQLTGLPASSPPAQACWIVSFDINGAGNFTLSGTDGTNGGLFGWSFATTSTGSAATPDGPIIAGNYLACSGTDGTRWDRRSSLAYPANFASGVLPVSGEEGTGMLTLDAFRIDGTTTAPMGPGCYFFQANPLASFHLELYSDVRPCPDPPVGTSFCFGSASCPCGMAPSNPGAGCGNEAGTGGAVLTATGDPSVTNDAGSPSLFLTVSQAPAFRTVVFIQGTSTIAAVPFGDGQRCVSGSLVRLNAPPPPPPPGDPTDAGGALTYPTVNHPLSVSDRTFQATGVAISPGDVRHYFAQYRDAVPNNCNVSLGGTVNTTQAITIVWGL